MKRTHLIVTAVSLLFAVAGAASIKDSYKPRIEIGQMYQAQTDTSVVSKSTLTNKDESGKEVPMYQANMMVNMGIRFQIDKKKDGGKAVTLFFDSVEMKYDGYRNDYSWDDIAENRQRRKKGLKPKEIGLTKQKTLEMNAMLDKYLKDLKVLATYDKKGELLSVDGLNEVRVKIMETEKDPKAQGLLIKIMEPSEVDKIASGFIKDIESKSELELKVGETHEETVTQKSGITSRTLTKFKGWDKKNKNVAVLEINIPVVKSVITPDEKMKSESSNSALPQLVTYFGKGSIRDNVKTGALTSEFETTVTTKETIVTTRVEIDQKKL